jgi:nitrogen fixation protein NifX
MTRDLALSEALALRIGLAARALPETSPARLMAVLVDLLGLPIHELKLETVTVKSLKNAKEGELSDIDMVYLKQAVRYLKGEQGAELDADVPQPQPYQDGDIPGSIRVAFASNSGERLNGHFGSCKQFLIYQLSKDQARLIDFRPVEEPETTIKDEKNAYRVSLINDCHILYVISIGGPPAAKVINAGVYPLKHPQEIEISEFLPELQQALGDRPAPWLAKLLQGNSNNSPVPGAGVEL